MNVEALSFSGSVTYFWVVVGLFIAAPLFTGVAYCIGMAVTTEAGVPFLFSSRRVPWWISLRYHRSSKSYPPCGRILRSSWDRHEANMRKICDAMPPKIYTSPDYNEIKVLSGPKMTRTSALRGKHVNTRIHDSVLSKSICWQSIGRAPTTRLRESPTLAEMSKTGRISTGNESK